MSTVLQSSGNNCWCTPQDLFDSLDAEFHFDLDAAQTDKSAKCARHFTPETDGLSQSWEVPEGKAVWCNPPYGRAIRSWVEKGHTESGNGNTVVMLLPSSTDTRWFHDFIYHQAEIRFLKGRIKFTDENGVSLGPAPFSSMIAIWRGQNEPR